MLLQLLLLSLLTIGACSGSTGSGIKIARVLLLAKTAEREVRRLLRPAARQEKEQLSRQVDSWDGVDRGLFDKLRELRREHATRQQVPAYVIFSDASLRDMARKQPSSPAELLAVHGVGDKKLADLGDDFLACIRAFCETEPDGASGGN